MNTLQSAYSICRAEVGLVGKWMGVLIGMEYNSPHACFPYWTDFNLNWSLLCPHPHLINIIIMTLIGPSGPVAISELYNFTQLQPAFWVNIGSVVHDPRQALWRLTSSRTQTQVDNHRQLIMDMGFSGCLFLYSWSCFGEWRTVCYRCSLKTVNSAGGLSFAC